MIKLTDIALEILNEDRCQRIANRKYDKPSAYKSGAIVRCRKGNIWKGLKEDQDLIQETMTVYRVGEIPYDENSFFVTPDYKTWVKFYPGEKIYKITTNKLYLPLRDKSFSSFDELRSKYKKGEFTNDDIAYINPEESGIQNFEQYEIKPDDIIDLEQINLTEDESLHKWFKRQGPKGKEGGWVDCNTCRNGKCKPCGRKEGEERAKYPSCRPTPAQCKTKGKGKKWGKTK